MSVIVHLAGLDRKVVRIDKLYNNKLFSAKIWFKYFAEYSSDINLHVQNIH